MMRIRYRIIDVLALLTIVSLVLGANIVGFRLSIPRFLTGDLDSYKYVEVVESEKSKHKIPREPLFDRSWDFSVDDTPQTSREYSIGQLGIGQSTSVRRISWLKLSYDIFLTVSTLLLVIAFAREIRRVRQSQLQN